MSTYNVIQPVTGSVTDSVRPGREHKDLFLVETLYFHISTSATKLNINKRIHNDEQG